MMGSNLDSEVGEMPALTGGNYGGNGMSPADKFDGLDLDDEMPCTLPPPPPELQLPMFSTDDGAENGKSPFVPRSVFLHAGKAYVEGDRTR